jgi:hypothetical protein
MWEWELRVMNIQEGAATEDPDPLCLGGRGAAPPESCCGPRGYRLMLKRQQQGAIVSDPALAEATIQLLSAMHSEQPASTWNLLRDALRERWQNVDRRLLEHGPLERASVCKKPTCIASNLTPRNLSLSCMRFCSKLSRLICLPSFVLN